MYLNPNCPLSFVNCAIKRFRPNEIHKTRVKENSVLILMLEGKLYFDEENISVALSPGEYYIQQSGLFQKGVVPSTGAVYFYLTFDGEYSILNGLELRGHFTIPRFRPMIDQMIELSIRPTTLFNNASCMYQIFSQLYTDWNRSKSTSKIAHNISCYLLDHYREPVSLDLLSEKFSYSGDYIIREFKRVYQQTPHAYLTGIRINAAKQMLLSTESPISQIAIECGFTDTSSFYRNFKSATSMTPKQWKQLM
ncbi:MAG: helix-turn-helix transcriptional regulator [Lachnospiraceae bacterium]|nr:helix-turn-helix transcriptional regulator [Lachnospiraceae bacterium]